MPRLTINLVKFFMALTALLSWQLLEHSELATLNTFVAISIICFCVACFFDICMESMDLGAFAFLCGMIACIFSTASLVFSGDIETFAIYGASITGALTLLCLTLNDCDMESFSSKYFYRALSKNGIVQNPKDGVHIGAPFWRYILFNIMSFSGVLVFIFFYRQGLPSEAWTYGIIATFSFLALTILDHLLRDFFGRSVLWTDRSHIFTHYHKDDDKSEA